MTTRTLIVAQNIAESYAEKIKKIVPDWNVIVGKDPSVWENDFSDAEVIIGWKKAMEQHLSQTKSLKWIQTWSAGVNSLPLEDLSKKNVTITSANGVHAYPISETIFAFMLGLTRKIHTYVQNQQEKKWHHGDLKLEIHGKTVGILGIGAIGKETAKIAKAFGMNVIGMRHSGKDADYVDQMYKPEQLNELLPQCDYVVVTLPLTDDTHRLIGKEQFQAMKNTAFFINIGRGDIVIEEELIDALQNEEILGAGLDVFEHEPLQETSPLWEMDNVIITPHTAGSTEHYEQRVIEDIFLPNLKSYVENSTPSINVVDYKKGY
ncbi:D-2-hydroxyacid dehydrogenase [Priestia koreensis]|uniref:D-2-hydroxyacid dehydrogenase n=1 Tax=Priestia koreensis TaxID=284581 RepID=UPI003459C7A3